MLEGRGGRPARAPPRSPAEQPDAGIPDDDGSRGGRGARAPPRSPGDHEMEQTQRGQVPQQITKRPKTLNPYGFFLLLQFFGMNRWLAPLLFKGRDIKDAQVRIVLDFLKNNADLDLRSLKEWLTQHIEYVKQKKMPFVVKEYYNLLNDAWDFFTKIVEDIHGIYIPAEPVLQLPPAHDSLPFITGCCNPENIRSLIQISHEEKKQQKDESSKQAHCLVFTQMVLLKGIKGLKEEFKRRTNDADPKEMTVCGLRKNKSKNTNNVGCLDATRVKFEKGGDYYNANYITTAKGRRIIAAQSPTSATMIEFYRLVAHEDVRNVVDLSSIEESTLYIPRVSIHSVKSGGFTVNSKGMTNFGGKDGERIKKTEVLMSDKNGSTNFNHFQWNGVVKGEAPSLELALKLTRVLKKSEYPLIFASANGTGRIAPLIYLLCQLDALDLDRPLNNGAVAVDSLRKQRAHLFENQSQYISAHKMFVSFLEASNYLPPGMSADVKTFVCASVGPK